MLNVESQGLAPFKKENARMMSSARAFNDAHMQQLHAMGLYISPYNHHKSRRNSLDCHKGTETAGRWVYIFKSRKSPSSSSVLGLRYSINVCLFSSQRDWKQNSFTAAIFPCYYKQHTFSVWYLGILMNT